MMKLKQILKKLAYFLVRVCSIKRTVLFESVPDCTDNTKAVFDEMIKRGLHRKYEFVWMLHGAVLPEKREKSVTYIPAGGTGLKYRFQVFSAYARAQCMICCNGFLLPVLKCQKSFFLSHGTPIKSVRSYYTIPNEITYCLATSDNIAPIMAYESRFPIERMFALGYPRNDVFAKTEKDVKPLLNTQCEKVIVWYPTFRQHKNGKKTGSDKALPLLHDLEAAKTINDQAARSNVLVVLKPHFAQDVSTIRELGLSNIRFINDEFLADHHISSYEFIQGCDALVSDYSSVYLDYSLADKPMAVVWEDIEDYRLEPGFSVDLDFYMKGAEKIYTADQFAVFIEQVSKGEDRLQMQRREICAYVNYAADGKNSSRVADFIEVQAEL